MEGDARDQVVEVSLHESPLLRPDNKILIQRDLGAKV